MNGVTNERKREREREERLGRKRDKERGKEREVTKREGTHRQERVPKQFRPVSIGSWPGSRGDKNDRSDPATFLLTPRRLSGSRTKVKDGTLCV